jgi:putative ATPase
MDLFENRSRKPSAPLAHRLRPESFDDFVGHEDVLAALRELPRQAPPSLILWGPPGCGKTTLAGLFAKTLDLRFVPFSAVTSGIAEIRQVFALAESGGQPIAVFVDEIHRFNRAQQDAFLPHVEKGSIVLIGATTENPSFEVNAPLLSRCRVFRMQALSEADVRRIVERAVARIEAKVGADAFDLLVGLANGDARTALNLLELAAAKGRVTAELVRKVSASRTVPYDKNREEHYNVVSAFIKSMRGSDPDAALYWLARMLEAGEDPLFVARRLVIFAGEDVSNADPHALPLAVAAFQAAHAVGMPEALFPLSQATTYLACAPKSNASYTAYLKAVEDVRSSRTEPVPLHLRNAATPLMRDEGYGKGYVTPHDVKDLIVDQEFLPPNLRGRRYYEPKESEAEIKKRLEEIRNKRDRARRGGAP